MTASAGRIPTRMNAHTQMRVFWMVVFMMVRFRQRLPAREKEESTTNAADLQKFIVSPDDFTVVRLSLRASHERAMITSSEHLKCGAGGHARRKRRSPSSPLELLYR